jgi:hypothetical protein
MICEGHTMTVSLLVLTPQCFSCSKLPVWISCIGAIETISERQALILTALYLQDEAGDFAAVLFTVMQGRSYAASGMSCAEVNQRLDEIVR